VAPRLQTQAPSFVKTEYPFIGNQVVGDFKGDGSLDLAGLRYLVRAIQVRLNNGAGTFGALVDYPAPWGQDLAAGDFNGDGRLDLVVTHNDPQISLSLLTGNGNGTFNAPVSFPNTSGYDSPDVVAVDSTTTPSSISSSPTTPPVSPHRASSRTRSRSAPRTVATSSGPGPARAAGTRRGPAHSL
jgi:hypothetical protein